MRRVITLAVAGGLLLGLGVLQVASAGSEEAATPSSSGVVHRLQLTSVQDGHKTSFHGWVDSKARNWRIEIGPRTYIGTPTKYTVIDKTLGMTYEREGSPRFLGRLNDSSLLSSIERALYKSPRIHKQRATASPFGPTIRVRVGGRAVAATVIGRMSSVTAAKRRLFATTQQLGTNTEREVPVTAFSRIPVRAFWLGSQAVGLTATTSVERHITRSPEEIDLGAPAHSDLIARTFLYIPPQANGRTSAIPGFLTLRQARCRS